MIDRFAKDKIHFIAAFKNKNTFFIVREILANGLDPNVKVDIMQIRTQDDEKKLVDFDDDQLQGMGNTLLSIAAYQILNDDQKEIIQLLLLMGAKDTNRVAQQLLEKQRADWYYTLKKKQGKTDDMCAKFGENWRDTVTKLIARTDEMLAMFKLQWNFDNEWKRNSHIRETVMTIFSNYVPRLNGIFSGKHTENIYEARSIINHLEKNPGIDYIGIADHLLNVGEPTNLIGEFNRRLNYCFNLLGLTHKRLSMTNLRLLVTPNEDLKSSPNPIQ